MLDKKKPLNGLVRDREIGPSDNYPDIAVRLINTWTVSIEDDGILRDRITELLRQKGETKCTIVITGKNSMTQAVMAFAESLGYDGNWCQIEAPTDSRVEELLTDIKETKSCIWHEEEGQVAKEGTAFSNGHFSLAVCSSKDRRVRILSGLDAVINCAGKAKDTLLVKEMISKGYIEQHEQLFPLGIFQSNRRLLFGDYGLIRRQRKLPPLENGSLIVKETPEESAPKKIPEDKDSSKGFHSLHVSVLPRYPSNDAVSPPGWEETFWRAAQVLLDIQILFKKGSYEGKLL